MQADNGTGGLVAAGLARPSGGDGPASRDASRREPGARTGRDRQPAGREGGQLFPPSGQSWRLRGLRPGVQPRLDGGGPGRAAIGPGASCAGSRRQPVAPWREVGEGPAQEVVHKTDIDLTTLLPIPTHNEYDSGPYITAGLTIARDPETGVQNVSIHRCQISGPDRIGILLLPRHTDHFYRKAEAAGQPLDIALLIGVDPATLLASQAIVPVGQDELEIAGALARPGRLDVVRCLTNQVRVPADAEIVIEGRLLPAIREPEGPFGEFPQYYGERANRHVLQVDAITHRRRPIFHTIVGGGLEHLLLLGAIPREATILATLQRTFPRRAGRASRAGRRRALPPLRQAAEDPRTARARTCCSAPSRRITTSSTPSSSTRTWTSTTPGGGGMGRRNPLPGGPGPDRRSEQPGLEARSVDTARRGRKDGAGRDHPARRTADAVQADRRARRGSGGIWTPVIDRGANCIPRPTERSDRLSGAFEIAPRLPE